MATADIKPVEIGKRQLRELRDMGFTRISYPSSWDLAPSNTIDVEFSVGGVTLYEGEVEVESVTSAPPESFDPPTATVRRTEAINFWNF